MTYTRESTISGSSPHPRRRSSGCPTPSSSSRRKRESSSALRAGCTVCPSGHPSPQAPFAIAVKAAGVGPSSTESPSSPYSSCTHGPIQDVGRHAEPRPAGPRERRQDRQTDAEPTWIDGVPCQPLAAAIACAAQTMAPTGTRGCFRGAAHGISERRREEGNRGKDRKMTKKPNGMRHLDDAIRRSCGGAAQDYMRLRTRMANAIVAQMLPDAW